MALIVENASGANLDINDLGITLETGEIADLTALASVQDIHLVSQPGEELTTLITAGDILVKDPIDEVTDLSVADALDCARAIAAPNYRIGPGGRLGDISDIDITGLTDGFVIQFNNGTGNYELVSPSTVANDIAIDDLTDVTITAPANGEVLTYNAGTWENSPAGGGSSDEITDADNDTRIRVEAAADDDTIRFDTGDSPVGYSAETDLLTISSSGLTVSYGAANAGVNGAPINISSGLGGTNADGGLISLIAGFGNGTGDGGTVSIFGGSTFGSGNGGDITIGGGGTSAIGAVGGDAIVQGGNSSGSGSDGGNVILLAGTGDELGSVIIQAPAGALIGPELRFEDASGGQYVSLSAPATVPSNYGLTWPDSDSVGTQALVSNGSGVLDWQTIPGAQNLWETITADAGSTTANTATDNLTITGGVGISTAISGDTLTITNDSPNVDQNLFETITADAGSTTANTTTDNLTIAGGTGISTSITGDTLTVTNDSPNVDQNLWETITGDSGSTTANTTTDNLTIAGAGVVSTAVSGDTLTISVSDSAALAACQARRTTVFNDIPLAWTDLDFDVTDEETDSAIIEHLAPTTQDQIQVKEAGVYEIYYFLTSDDEVQGRVRINDTTVIPGSTQQSGDPTDANNVVTPLSVKVFATLAANDLLTVQIQAATTAENLFADALFIVQKLEGRAGPQGPAGSGSTITLEEGGTPVVNTPHDTIDFDGSDFNVTDNADGSATVTLANTTFATNPGFFIATASTNITTTETTVPLNNEQVDPDNAYSTDGTNVTFNEAGWYWISVHGTADVDDQTGGARGIVRWSIQADDQGNGAFVDVPGLVTFIYQREAAEERTSGSSSVPFLVEAGDRFRLRVDAVNGTVNASTSPNECHISMHKIREP